MVLDLKTKRGMSKSCTICKTPDNEWAWAGLKQTTFRLKSKNGTG